MLPAAEQGLGVLLGVPLGVGLVALLGGACGVRAPCNGIMCAAACPREASPDASGRCACTPGNVVVLGACVRPAIGDAFCGPAATVAPAGCVFRRCTDDELLDATSGACLRRSSLSTGRPAACGADQRPILTQGRATCVAPDDTCPRGSRWAASACARPPTCPAGSIAVGTACQSVVTEGGHGNLPRVDVGAWVALVVGPDRGPGTPELCRPLSLRPDVFALAQGTAARVEVRVAVAAPDQDLTRVHAAVHGELHAQATTRPLSGEAEAVVANSVAPMLEALRGLGGEASTTVVEVRVSCRVSGL